jgi:predicted Zn-dependent peptidase
MARHHALALPLAGALLLPTLMNAQVDRTQAPEPGPAPTVNIGDHRSFTLANGMRVIVVENHKLPLVSVQVKFDIEPVLQGDLAGYQDLVGEVLGAGTARHTKEELDELIDGMGASLSTSSDGLYASVLSRNFNQLMGLVYEVVTSASFPPAEVEKARTRMISSVRTRADDPDQIAEAVGRALTYGKDHPYGEVPTEATLARVRREHLYAYYQRFFRPEDGYLVFVGDITEAEARTLAERLFAGWKGATVKTTQGADGTEVVEGLGPVRKATVKPRATRPRSVCFVDRPGSAQSVIKVCFPVDLPPNDPMALSGQVMNTILGGGVFNARLMQNLREDKAYTYGAYSSLEADRYVGSWSGGCSVRNEVTDSAVMQVLQELERIMEEPVTDAELELTRNYMAGSFARGLEDPRTVARFALNTYLYDLRPDHYATYLARLDTVSRASVQEAARRFLFPENAVVLVVGDKRSVANSLTGLSLEDVVLYYDINGDRYREAGEPVPAGVTVQKVIEDYLAAIGGRPAIERIRDVRKRYTATVQGMEVSLAEVLSLPGNYRLDMQMGPMTLQRIVCSGGRGYFEGPDGRMELVDQALQEAMENAWPVPEAKYAEHGYEVRLTGMVEVDGRQAYRLRVTTPSDRSYQDYYDVETGLKVKRTETQATPKGTIEVNTLFADHKPTAGVLFPHRITQSAGVLFEFEATAIDVNKGVDPSVFNVDGQ